MVHTAKNVYISKETGLKESRASYFAIYRTITNFAASGTSDDVTLEINGSTTSHQDEGSETKSGVMVIPPYNRAEIVDSVSGDPILDPGGNLVYGRITHTLTGLSGQVTFTEGSLVATTSADLTTELAPDDLIVSNTSKFFAKVASVTPTQVNLSEAWLGPDETTSASKLQYTISYYSMVASVQTPYSLAQNIDIDYIESINSQNLPFNAFLIQGGVGGGGGYVSFLYENLPVTVPGQTVFTLTNPPLDDNDVILFVNGIAYENGVDYTVSGTTLTWLNLFILKTKDVLLAYYTY